MIGRLSSNSNGQGLGFQSSIFQTKPRKTKLNKFANFLSHPSTFYDSDIECLMLKQMLYVTITHVEDMLVMIVLQS